MEEMSGVEPRFPAHGVRRVVVGCYEKRNFIHSLNKHLLGNSYVSDTKLGVFENKL